MANNPRPEKLMTPTGSVSLTTKVRTVEGDASGVETIDTIKNFIDSENNENNILYVGKHGNDTNSGKTHANAFLTIGAAIAAASGETPAADNRFKIEIVDAGNYTENLTIPEWVGVIGLAALIDGQHTVADNTALWAFRLLSSTGTCITKSTGSGSALIRSERMILTNGTNGTLVTSGQIVFEGGSIEVENGFGFGSTSSSDQIVTVDGITITGTGIGAGVSGSGEMCIRTNCIMDSGSGTGLQTIGTSIVNAIVNRIECNTTYNEGVNTSLNLTCVKCVGATVKNGNGKIVDNANVALLDDATFISFPLTPSSVPTANYHVTNKKYVDDLALPVSKETIKTGSNCLTLNGSNNYISVSPNTDFEFGTGDFSLFLNVKFDTIKTGRNNFIEQSGNNQRALQFEYDSTANRIRLGLPEDKSSGSSWDYADFTYTMVANTDYYIVAYRESGTTYLYINGSLVSSTEGLNGTNQDTGSTAPIAIGALYVDASNTYYHIDGKIFGVGITKGTLSTTDKTAIQQGNIPSADNLSLYLPLAEGSGSVAYDVSENDNHGTINGTLTNVWDNTQDDFHYNNDYGFSGTYLQTTLQNIDVQNYKVGNEPSYLIDGNDGGTHFHSNSTYTNFWVKTDLLVARIVKKFSWGFFINTEYMSDTIEIHGSNDDSSYTLLGTAVTDRATPTWLTELELDNSTAYRYYKLVFVSSVARYIMGYEWKLYAQDSINGRIPALTDGSADAIGGEVQYPSELGGTLSNGSETAVELVVTMEGDRYDFSKANITELNNYPLLPETNPTVPFQVASKKYVDDNSVLWDYTTNKATGNCILLSSATGCIKTPNVVYDKIGTDDFSINFLVKRNGANRSCIFAWGSATDADRNSLQIDIDESNDNLRFAVTKNIGGVRQDLSSFEIVTNDNDGKILNDGNWYKCAVLRKNRTFYMYVNGVSVPYTNKYSSDLENVSIEAFDYGWTIGQTEHGILQMEGYVSGIQFTAGSLVDEDLQRVISCNPINEFGKVISNYPLAEGAGGIVYESSGNGKSGYITSAFTSAWGNTQDNYFYNNDKGFSDRLFFDGSTNYVTLPNGGGIGSTFIIGASFLMTDIAGSRKILNFRPSGGDQNEIRLEIASGKLKLTAIDASGSGGNTYKQYTCNTEVQKGLPYKVLMVWDGTDLKGYLKESDNEYYEDAPYVKGMDGSLSMTDTTRIRRLGASTSNSDKFKGLISDIFAVEYSLENLNKIFSGEELTSYSRRWRLDEVSGTNIEDSSGNNDDGVFQGTMYVSKVPALLNGLTDASYDEVEYPALANGAIGNNSETTVATVRINDKYSFKSIELTDSTKPFKPNSGTTTQLNALTGMTGGEEYYDTDRNTKFIYNNSLSSWVEV